MGYELLGQITHVSDHVWSEQVSNFARYERNLISGQYEAQKVDIPIPLQSYIRIDKVEGFAMQEYSAQILPMYFKGGVEFTMKNGKNLILEIVDDHFPMYVCLDLKTEM